MTARRILVTGGSGFIGSALVRALVQAGETVRVLDDNSRGALRRLAGIERDIEFVQGDIRDAAAVDAATRGIDEVHHLAYVNGTATFYSDPDLVLDVGVKGMINVIDACRRQKVGSLVLASSSEVYQTPPQVPTAEDVPLVVPDPHNPRLSYGAGKIISEVMSINFGRKYFERVLIFRPHNVYGPDMGFEHVIPQFAVRLKRACAVHPHGKVPFPIQGSGAETRSFCHVDDLVAGVMVMREKGEHLGIYHVGTTEEIGIADLASRMAAIAGRDIALERSAVLAGSTTRRCPDISKLAALGYRPRVPLEAGLPPTLAWYWEHEREASPVMSAGRRLMSPFPQRVARAAGTGASVPVECCQVCGHAPLETVLSLGYMPPVNQMVPIGQVPRQQPWFPTDLLYCGNCELVQLGLAVDPVIIFPPEYPYTSGNTKLLRDNFADLCAELSAMLKLQPQDLVIDIGSNDGTLLSNFQKAGYRALGIEPTEVSRIAAERGIPTVMRYFSPATAAEVRREHGAARVVTAANCFAHMEDVHAIVAGILELLEPDGVFISESHYLIGLLDTFQYDTVYHEHLRYYSLTSLAHLLGMHGLEVFHARPIPSHGGSIRVYAARRGMRPVNGSVAAMLAAEPRGDAMRTRLAAFRNDVLLSKLRLMSLIRDYKEQGMRICGISAPSRASTLFNYVGLDDAIIDYVCEIAGSLKIGKCMPGTAIPVVEEGRLFDDQPEVAIIFSWHIADELAPKLRAKGYRGKLVTPLPVPREL